MCTSAHTEWEEVQVLVGEDGKIGDKTMRAITTVAILFVCVVAAPGQTNKGGISGTVLDANGAAVPGATVTITNLGTNQAQKVTTSETGGFSVQSLEPVTYSISVEVPGFKKAVVESVKVD